MRRTGLACFQPGGREGEPLLLDRVEQTQHIGTLGPHEYKALGDRGAQCALMTLSHTGEEPTCISGVTRGSQQLTVLETEVSLTRRVTKNSVEISSEVLCIIHRITE